MVLRTSVEPEVFQPTIEVCKRSSFLNVAWAGRTQLEIAAQSTIIHSSFIGHASSLVDLERYVKVDILPSYPHLQSAKHREDEFSISSYGLGEAVLAGTDVRVYLRV